MSKPDKPIFNQQGGRGKLYGPTHGATYMGTYQMPDGKMDRQQHRGREWPLVRFQFRLDPWPETIF